MRKRTAYFLALCLILSCVSPALAAGMPDVTGASAETSVVSSSEEGEEASLAREDEDPSGDTAAPDRSDEDIADESIANTDETNADTDNADVTGAPAEDGPAAGVEKTAPESEEGSGAPGADLPSDGEAQGEDEVRAASISAPAGEETGSPAVVSRGAKKGSVVRIVMGRGRAVSVNEDQLFSVSLARQEGGDAHDVGEKQIRLSGENSSAEDLTTASFSGLNPGEYTFTISGAHYETYTQQVQVEALREYTYVIYTGTLGGYSYEEGKAHPGVIRIGDATGDGLIQIGGEGAEDDADRIIAAMEADEPDEETRRACDLNNDGLVNMADLQYLVSSCYDGLDGKGGKDLRHTEPEVSLSPEAVAVGASEELQIQGGELGALLDRDSGTMLSLGHGEEEPITREHPISLSFALGEDAEQGTGVELEGLTIAGNADNPVTEGYVEVELENNKFQVPITNAAPAPVAMLSLIQMERASAVWEDGVLVVDFGDVVPVKKVTFVIQGTKNNRLAEISQVEFLNDMDKRIPAPKMDIPKNVQAHPGDEMFTVSWTKCENITGYEVRVACGDSEEVRRTAVNKMEIASFHNEDLVNGQTYEVQVQAVNGDWKSGYGEAVQVTPFSDSRPAAPDNLVVQAGYRYITASWKKMKNTERYNLYYKKASDTEYQAVRDLTSNSYVLEGLEDAVSYRIYVTGINQNGEGPGSLEATATTVDIKPVKLPGYRLVNRSKGEGQVSEHVVSASYTPTKERYVEGSPLDEGSPNSALAVVDNSYLSYYMLEDWDDGKSYPSPSKGVTVELDQAYHLGYICLAQSIDYTDLADVRVYGDDAEVQGVSLVRRTDANGRKYYLIKLPIDTGYTAKKWRICLNTGWTRKLNIGEITFHLYDSLEKDIMALFGDDLHTTLREGVTQAELDGLQNRLNQKEDGEYHMDREELQAEFDIARELFDYAADLTDRVKIHSTITAARDGGLGFGGLNAWQPLGVSTYAGENLIVYVGSNKGKTGSNSDLTLVVSQYHAEANRMTYETSRLKVGRNEISIRSLQEKADFESGGSLYIAYKGNNANDDYAVRVRGGVKIPVLDLYQVADRGEKLARAAAYIDRLDAAKAALPDTHRTCHEGSGVKAVSLTYNEKNCIAGATEILLDQMLLSVSTEQILAGLGEGSTSVRAEKLVSSMEAMDQMMRLFYQHKGLNASAENPLHDLPSQHLNIRYQRMFAGAFMYASGDHIGIEWPEIKGLAGASPIVTDASGNYQSGSLFGWGIGHEVGHDINQGSYAIAEITNNYFAQLSTYKKEGNESVRFHYEDVYDKVTSGTTGRASNVFVQLAMYWQLHLAYDRGYNYTVYDDYQTQLDNLFYARVDTYARDPGAAPAGKNGIALKLDGGVEQNFMRLASAAAERNLTEFFRSWGMVPDAATAAYMAQFEPETRAICYASDDARYYELQHGASGGIAGQDVVSAKTEIAVDPENKNQVHFTICSTAQKDMILGYEITRVTIANGEEQEQVVGFSWGENMGSFTDTVTSINNRVLTYKITAVDQFLNRSNSLTLGPVKIEHPGDHDKDGWTVSLSGITTKSSSEKDATEEIPCGKTVKDGTERMLDNDLATAFQGEPSMGPAEIVLDFHQTLDVSGIRCRSGEDGDGPGKFEVQVSADGANWTTVLDGASASTDAKISYFENGTDNWICTYSAAYLKLILKDAKAFSIAELDVIGPSGDNVDLGAAVGQVPAEGYLKEDYVYDSKTGDKIPAGSLVFIGAYRGNPAYNVVILYDESGRIVGGVDENGALRAEQILQAPPLGGDAELGETSKGSWIYWIEPKYLEQMRLPARVRAELYRVDNALTNEGQRLVSDSVFFDPPTGLPEIQLSASVGN